MNNNTLTVSQLAKHAKVTIRTLHHYDDIGLLSPKGRSPGGYRLYGQDDIAKLQQILLFRELGLPLEQIRMALRGQKEERLSSLGEQRQALERKIERLWAMMEGLDETIAALKGGRDMDMDKAFGVNKDPNQDAYEAEAKERWGETDSYKISAKRTGKYTPADWAAIKAESSKILGDMGELMARGEPPESDGAVDLAEAYRLHFDRWFYPCSREAHQNLGQMYLADERFAATFEAVAEGLTVYLAGAITANLNRSDLPS